VETLGRLAPPLITCEAVLSETLFLLRADAAAPQKVATLLERKLLVCHPVLDRDAAAVLGLMQAYRDVPMPLADACLVRLSERMRSAVVVTLDSDFGIYRRHRRQAIPLLCPRR
jgi:predicted nucleic acid-binding protein